MAFIFFCAGFCYVDDILRWLSVILISSSEKTNTFEMYVLINSLCLNRERERGQIERERERDCSHHWSTHLSQGWNQRPGVPSTSPTWGQGLNYLSCQCCPKFLQEPELSLNSRHSDTWCCCLNHYLTTRPTVCSLLPLDCFSILSPRTHQDFYYH